MSDRTLLDLVLHKLSTQYSKFPYIGTYKNRNLKAAFR